ncbi:MAG: hypothetical protein MZU97_19045 [Bacillus subtilis]|nr:hypothetical protein [Bacillus subtilis]
MHSRRPSAPIVQELGYELYDHRNWVKVRKNRILQRHDRQNRGNDRHRRLRQAVSEALSPLSRRQLNPITRGLFSLEVTSPGAERELRNPAEIERFNRPLRARQDRDDGITSERILGGLGRRRDHNSTSKTRSSTIHMIDRQTDPSGHPLLGAKP